MIESKIIEKFMEENDLEPYDAFDVDGEFKQCNPLYFNEDLELRSMEFDSRNLEFFGGKACLYRLLTSKDRVKHRRTEINNPEVVAEEENMKLIWKKYSFGWQKETRLVLIDDDNRRRAIAIIVESQKDESETKSFHFYCTLHFGDIEGLCCSYKSFEEAKRATLQFLKEEAIKTMKEITYITNFIDE